MSTAVFTPYLPRVLIDWQRETPQARVREIEGTLVFVDISGFTKMSERLARKGRVGAEEVTGVLNTTFARLLAVAYENGGSLIKFGGDALLLFFMGRAHAARACHAAVGMRRKLREVGHIQTSAGLVRLRMSIGVHTGSFHFFLVGDSHRELVITGPDATRTVEMEHAATAGEILVSPATAACLDPGLLGEEKEGGVLLKKAPAAPPLPGGESGMETVRADLAAFVPTTIRSHLTAGASEEEHRQVTVAFIHFGGIDDLLASRPAAEVADRLDALVRAVQYATSEYEITFLGTDIDAGGGKIILIAGAPQAFDNDEERMLRALRTIADRDHGLPLRMGVNRGHVFAGDVGPPYRRTYTVIGDDVNLAARLMQKAQPGEVISTTDVLDRSRTLFETEPLEPFTVKGKAEAIIAFRVGHRAGAREEETSGSLPMLGREHELRELARARDDALAGAGRLIEIVGEAGIGKTRLIEELKAGAGKTRFLLARCGQYEAATPYFAFRGLLRYLARIGDDEEPATAGKLLEEHIAGLAPDLAPWLPLLAIPVGASTPMTRRVEELAPEFRASRMRQVVGDYVSRLVPVPGIVVFEDVHWMDEASASLLRHLVEEVIPNRPWLVCATRRPEQTGFVPDEDSGRPPIALEGLSPDASIALANAAGGEDLLPPQAAAVAERSGGHPLFLMELVAAGAGTDSLEALPDTVESLITARIDRLGAAEKTTLRHAAVLGMTFSLDLLSEASGSENAGDPLVWMHLHDFLEPVGRNSYRFRQALFRDVAYEELPYRTRRELHRRAGEALERRRDPDSGLLSLHFHRAQAFEKSWRYSRLAGEHAKDKFANVQAAEYLRRALEAGRHVDEIGRGDVGAVWEALGDVCEVIGLYAEAAEAYKNARRLMPAEHQPSLMLKEGVIRERLGQYSQALRWFGRGLKAAGAVGQSAATDRVRLLIEVAIARHRQGQYAETIRIANDVCTEAGAAGDRRSLGRAYHLLQAAYTDIGKSETAYYGEQALTIYEELGDLVGQANVADAIGVNAYWHGRWDDALSYYDRAFALRERAGQSVYAQLDVNNIAEILSDQGRLAEAEEKFREARRILRAARHTLGVAHTTGNLGRVASRGGRFDEAEELLNEALSLFHGIGAENAALETEARVIELLVFRGNHAPALERATWALERAAQMGGMAMLRAALHRLQGYALLQGHNHVLAQDALDESLHLARQANAEYEMALTYQAWQHLARITARHSSEEKFAELTKEIFARLGVAFTPAIPLPERLP